MLNVTSDKPVLECEIGDLEIANEPRNHSKNIYTALEWFIGKRMATNQLIELIKG